MNAICLNRFLLALGIFFSPVAVVNACIIDSVDIVQPTCTYLNDGSLTIYASGAPNLSYSIDGGANFNASNVFTNLAPGTYNIVVQSPQPCSVAAVITISSSSTLSAGLGVSNIAPFINQDITFTDQSIGHTSSTIDFGDGTDTTGVNTVAHAYTLAGVYTAMIITSDGTCADTAFQVITVAGTSSLLISNVFSPNEDDVNDLFMPVSFGVKELTATILNRYGEVVHTWVGPNGYWDGYTQPSGVKCPEGTYFYWIVATGFDGVEYDEKGTITLLR